MSLGLVRASNDSLSGWECPQVTPPTQGGSEGSVRLQLTKIPRPEGGISYERLVDVTFFRFFCSRTSRFPHDFIEKIGWLLTVAGNDVVACVARQ